jgi:hypothetical protein
MGWDLTKISVRSIDNLLFSKKIIILLLLLLLQFVTLKIF